MLRPSRHPAPTLDLERQLWEQGCQRVAGVDEVGRGPLAGPLVAAAVILSPQTLLLIGELARVRDSKLLRAAQRETLDRVIRREALGVGLAVIEADAIDQMGMGPAGRLALARAVRALPAPPDYALIDGFRVPQLGVPHQRVVHGDRLCVSIAAASIVAKVYRDRLMVAAEADYPGYGFARHKGYGTAEHLAQLRARGPCPLHRRCFAPVAACSAMV